MFWTGRYVERAQALARAVLAYQRLSFDLPSSRPLDLKPLVELAGAASAPRADHAGALRALVFAPENASSVQGALLAARENLRQARVVVPVELWTTLTAATELLARQAVGQQSSLLEALEGVLALGNRFEGERHAGMAHDAAYAFLEIGSKLERADMLLRVLSALPAALLPNGWERRFDDVRWTGLLHALGLHADYRRRYHHQTDLAKLLELALVDVSVPRSVAHCLRGIEGQLRHLPRAGRVRPLLVAAQRDLRAALNAEAAPEPLLRELLERLAVLGQAFADWYFPSHFAPPAPAARPAQAVPARPDPFERLGREHALVASALRLLDDLVLEAEAGRGIAQAELLTIVTFLTDFGELGHYEKEEAILTPLLAANGFDWYEGPLAAMRRDHRREHYFIRSLTQLASQRGAWTREDAGSFVSVASEFSHFLRTHMDHEQHEVFEPAARNLPAELQAGLWLAFEEFDAKQCLVLERSWPPLERLIEKYYPPVAVRTAV
jgi:uncharacterized alpha-E superfamily protein/hemerythrin-like domain-containing protein